MIKTLDYVLKMDKERWKIPRSVQDVIPVWMIWQDGIFQVGRQKFSKTFRFTDINYAVADQRDKETMLVNYSTCISALETGATTKITIHNRRITREDFEQKLLYPMKQDDLDALRKECNAHSGEEPAFQFSLKESMRLGHSFKDYIVPDTFEFESDHFRMGERYGRVLFLRDYASYIADDMVSKLCELNKSMMLSLDIIPVPTDEAVRDIDADCSVRKPTLQIGREGKIKTTTFLRRYQAIWNNREPLCVPLWMILPCMTSA